MENSSMMSYLFTAVIMVGIGGYVFFSARKNHQKMQKAVSKWEEKEARKSQGLPDEADSSYFAPFTGGYEKLSAYKEIPHPVDEAFYKIYEKPPTFGKEKWQERVANYPLVYAAVVQAYSPLYETPEEDEDNHGGMVMVAAMSRVRCCDAAWIQGVAKKVQEVRDSAKVPEDAKKIVKLLRDTESGFCEILPVSLTGGEEVWCWTATAQPLDLPDQKIPSHRILPFIMQEPEVNMGGFRLISAKAYR